MSETTLAADTGRPTGSRPANRLRAEGRVPAVVYGQGMEPVAVSVDRRELRQALSGPAGVNALISLTVDGATHPTIVKQLDRHPLRRTVMHVDFLKVNLDEDIEVAVPLTLVGEAKAVLSEGGLVDPAVDTITVRTRPNTVPNELPIDVSELTIGDVLRLSDLQVPAGVELVDDPDMVIVTALGQAAEEEPEVVEGEEEEEAAEGEAVPAGDEGAAGAGEGGGGDADAG
ncbi:MAG TPA: 50S ribosomal protein L25 [Acidimicrobiales bacterium]|jgi:large subunit ribosomal protein L25|nr:50S ribosomal protein L25 [Acidimicrobiales bacterium]